MMELMKIHKRVVLLICLLLGAVAVQAQPKFTYADIAAGKFAQKSVAGLRSMADGEHYTVMESDGIYRYAYAKSGVKELLVSLDRVDGEVAD